LFANKFRRAERKRITLNPVTAGPGELGIWKAETRTHLMSRQGLPGSHLKKNRFQDNLDGSTDPLQDGPESWTHKFPAHAIAQTPIQIQRLFNPCDLWHVLCSARSAAKVAFRTASGV
jgi:hypothetical protein